MAVAATIVRSYRGRPGRPSSHKGAHVRGTRAIVKQPAVPGELGRRVVFEPTESEDEVHVIIEMQDFNGDESFSDEAARVTVKASALSQAVGIATGVMRG